MATRWNYSGDIDLRYGGFFWREDGADDYVLAVRVTSCSDAGGPDNLFHVETGSVYMPRDKYATALDCCGYKLGRTWKTGAQVIDSTGAVLSRKDSRSMLVDAFMAYHGSERDAEYVIRIGPAEPDARGWCADETPDFVLRSNAKLENFVRRELLA